jgi:hypothetical protein
MSSTSPSRILVDHIYGTDNHNHHFPSQGEVIVVSLSQPLFGPVSGPDLPPENYHHAVVIDFNVHVSDSIIKITVLPIPAHSVIDSTSGLSSTSWLLSQPADYQRLHIPVPYEQIPPVMQPHPPFPTPVHFGDPIEVGGWKNCRPSWVLVVPLLIELTFTTKVRIEFPWRQVLLTDISDIVQVL